MSATDTQVDFDLDSALQKTSARLVLKHPVSGQPTSAWIEIAGPEHPARKAAVFARMRARRQEMERTGKLTISDPADDEQDETALLAACTLGWSLKAGGQALAFSADACTAFYADPARAWVREQVKAALDQRELFIGSSATA